jgi:hypothetical protein
LITAHVVIKNSLKLELVFIGDNHGQNPMVNPAPMLNPEPIVRVIPVDT